MTINDLSYRESSLPREWPAIRRVSVSDLFGRYTYEDIEFSSSGNDENVAILYGDNGTGKTTILKLIYSSLAWTRKGGNRTHLAVTPFSRLFIELNDGSSVEVSKLSGRLTGSYDYRISRSGFDWPLRVTADKENNITDDLNPRIQEVSDELRKLEIELLLLEDNRKIRSTYDFFSESRDKSKRVLKDFVISNNVLLNYSSSTWSDTLERPRFQDIEEAQGVNLSQIIRLVGIWIGRRALQKSSSGDEDASNVYLNIVRALSYHEGRRHQPDLSKSALVSKLTSLNLDVERYRKHGLVGAYPIEEFGRLVVDAPTERLRDVSDVMLPYIDSIRTRLNAFEEVRAVMESFQEEMGSYLRDKRVTLRVGEGPIFFDNRGKMLPPSALSSGERQLVFLFCAALLSRGGNSIFMIDEPELSLNVKWQRRLVSSLVKIARGAATQFVMASHSIEIASKHRRAIAKLD